MDQATAATPGTGTSGAAAHTRTAIVGAGLAGSLLAILLRRRGHTVTVYERRPDPRDGALDEGRSINLGVSARGIRALREVGLWEALAGATVPMRGRAIHRRGAELRFTPYGTRPEEILHSVRRNDLTAALVASAEHDHGVTFHFGQRCTGLDRDSGALTLTGDDGRSHTVHADLVVGADGAFSAVRAHLHDGSPADYQQEFLSWGYRELTIPPHPDGTARTRLEALHLWPSDHGLVVAHPNTDGSLTGTLLLPHEDDPARGQHASFASLTTPDALVRHFAQAFPELLELVPDLTEQFFAHPVSHLVTIRTAPWHHRDRVVLIGDACHAVYPFYGQGMNAAFEDCLVLAACLDAHPGDRGAALAAYQQQRKPHTDVLADLAADNFTELRDRVRNPLHLARGSVDRALHRLAPTLWQPLYRMVSHTTTGYADALARARRQDRILAWAAGLVATGVTAGTVAGAAAGARARRRRVRG